MKLLTKSVEGTMPVKEKRMSVKTFTPEVQHTNKYKQFKTIPGNRPVSERHVRELAESYLANPNLVELRPILVNEKLELIDGQHRVLACERNGIEVPYIVAPGLTVATAQLMNALQKPWSLLDFARSYAYSGNKHYQKFEYLMDEYALNPTVTLAYVKNGYRATTNSKFKNGHFEMPEDYKTVEDRFALLSTFDDYKVIPWHSDRFAKAFLHVMNLEDYNHERMLHNLALAAPSVKPQADRLEWLRELERVYNYNIKSDIKRFF